MADFDPTMADRAFAAATASPAHTFDPDAADEVLSDELQGRLAGAARAAATASPEALARANGLARKAGLPVGAVLADLPEFEARDIADRFWSAPEATRAFLADPTNAALAKDDLGPLTRLEGSMTAMQSFGRGVDLLQSMLYGSAEWAGEATGAGSLAGWGRAGRQRNEAEAAAHGFRSRFLGIGGAADTAQWGKETLFEQLPLISPALAGAMTGAGLGASVGGPYGAAVGGLIGGFVPSAVMGIGEVQSALKEKDPTAEAPGAVLVGGLAIGLLDSIVPGRIGGRLALALGRDVAERVVRRGIAAAGGALLKGAGIEGATEAAQEAIGEVAAAHGARQEIDWKGLGPRMVEAGAAGILLGASVHGATQGVELLAERQKAADARNVAAALAEAAAAAQESRLATRDPERFAELVRQIAGNGPLHIRAESLQSLYQSGAIDESTLTGLDVTAQLPEALAAGGDVLVDPAKYLAAASRLTPEALAQMIRNTRRGPADMTLAEADAHAADPARETEIADLLDSLAAQYDGARPGQIVEDQVTEALVKTGRYTDSQARAQAVLWRERMIVRAKDRGMDPDALWLEEAPPILGPAPRLPVDDIDLVLERIRSGNEVTPPRQPVLDIFRGMGGVRPGSELARELAAMGITPKEAPGLFRPTGIGAADRVVVSEHEVLRDNGVKADGSGNGYADHDSLMQAVAREWAGDPLQTQADRDRISRLDEPVRELRAALEAEGIIPEQATKEQVLRLIGRDPSAAALGQPVNAGVDPDRMVRVVDITGMFDAARDKKSLVQMLRPLIGERMDTADQGRIASILPKKVDHIAFSVIRTDHRQTRKNVGASVNSIVDLLERAVLIESAPNRKTADKPGIDSYHRFYVPVWDGKATRTVRIVAEQSKAGIRVDPNAFDIYEVIQEPGASADGNQTSQPAPLVGGHQKAPPEAARPREISIRQMLSGVKDMRGRVYFQSMYRHTRGGPDTGVGYMMFAIDGEAVRGYGDNRYTIDPDHLPSDLVIDASDRKFVDAVRKALLGHEAEVEEATGHEFGAGLVNDLSASANPINIVDSAGLWDNPELVRIVWDDAIDPNGWLVVKTHDGAIVFDASLVSSAPNDFYQPDGSGARGSFDPIDDSIRLFESANLSTFLHEGGHLWLFQMIRDLGDQRLLPEARARITRDLQTVMDWLKVDIDVAAASPAELQAAIPVEAHEHWARGIEAYLMEGKAPSPALRDVFARFSAWLIRIYKKVARLDVKLTPQIRGVMDRLLATDAAIEQARGDRVYKAPSDLLAVLTPAERREIEAKQEQAALEARAELQGRVMRELARERLAWWREERAKVSAEIEAEARTRPAHRLVALSRGIGPDGQKLIDPDTGAARALKLDRKALVVEYGEEIVKLLPAGVTAAKGGVNHHIVAGWFGLPHGDALRLALMDAKANPLKDVVGRETDARMRARHGDMVTDGRIAEDAADIVATGKAIEAVALQAKALKRLAGEVIAKAAARKQATEGAGSRETDLARIDAATAATDQTLNAGVPAEGATAAQVGEAMAAAEAKAAPLQRTAQRAAVRQTRSLLSRMDHAAIKKAAAAFIAARQVSQATDATMYRAQAKRHERRATLALAARDYVEAFDAKQQQVLNMELEAQARAAKREVEEFAAKARRLNKPDATLAATVDEDFFKAARQVLARHGLARADSAFDAKVWLDRLTETDPAGAADIAAIIATLTAAPIPGRVASRTLPSGRRVEIAPDYRDMTLAAFRALKDGIGALLEMGRNARSAEIEGERVAFERMVQEAAEQLEARSRDRDLSHMPTDTEKTRRGLLGIVASWRIAESWARAADLGQVGVMTKYIIRPVLDAIHAYRDARRIYQEKLLAILSPVRDDLAKPRIIAAPELNGFEFHNKGQLLHAILHTGNDSNMKKLLVGWEWATLNRDGSVNTLGWTSFMARMFADGVVTKADMDLVQSIWDLLESTKPAAQAAHKAMFGYAFREIEARPVKTPFGEYRGGYVPALTEKSLIINGAGQEAVEALTGQQSAAMFPAADRGSTKSRVEGYAEPLALDPLLLPAHLNKVLLFSHVGPAVRQVARLVNRRDFREAVGRYDPVAIDGILWPFLGRAARQTVETPALTPGGRKAADFARYLRATAGLQAMCGNLLNAAQQITGLSSAATMVGGGALARALITVWRNPDSSMAAIMAKSPLMRERAGTSAVDAAMDIQAILKDQGALRKGQAFAQRHGYFAQQIAQNLVDRVVWWAAYDKALGEGGIEAEAIQRADSAVRLTQGSFNPESIAAVEAGTAWIRLFTQFMTYFIAQWNMLVTEATIAVRTMTGSDLSIRLAGIYIVGFLIPSVVAEAIMQAGRGELGDEDDDGWADDLASLFLLPQLRFFAAMVPVAGPVAMLGVNTLNDRPYDDRLAAAPAVTLTESAGRAAVTTARAIAGDGDASRAVSDAMNAVSVITGIPTGFLRKPLSYAVDVAEGESRPRHIGNVASGVLTGQDGTAR